MPYYASLTELPIGVRGNLPVQAQEVYRKAFNSAWMQYNQPAERIDDATREETSHRVAWAAVKRDYEKDERTGFWRPISLTARPEMFSSVPTRTASSAVAAKSPASRTAARKAPAKSAKKPTARAAKPAAKKPVKRVASSKTSASRTGAKKKAAKPVKRKASKTLKRAASKSGTVRASSKKTAKTPKRQVAAKRPAASRRTGR